jgi:hypothetical protein
VLTDIRKNLDVVVVIIVALIAYHFIAKKTGRPGVGK